MDKDFILLSLVIALITIIAIVVKLVSFFKDFAEDNRYICYRMDYADSYEEYRRWRGELRCQYLMLLPFVNGKNVMRVYRFIFRKSRQNEKEERKDSVMLLFLPSILGVCICLVCICGMTWAWYSANVQMSAQKMTTANYEVHVTSVMGNNAVDSSANGDYLLEAGTEYTIVLQADGSVRKCSGYCLIENEKKTEIYYTQTFSPKESITIKLTPKESGTYSFTGVWGSLPAMVSIESDQVLKNFVQEEVPVQTVIPENIPAKESLSESTTEKSVDISEETPISEPVSETPVITDTVQTDVKDDVVLNKEE